MDKSFMSADSTYYVQIKNDSGEYEDLGVMSAREALKYSWNHEHRAINMVKVGPNGK
ncbi:MAG: hypothetical protein IKA48_00110 [Fibrobacter sp.]|nr:hypothetical protein [Fibrobacter sp.]